MGCFSIDFRYGFIRARGDIMAGYNGRNGDFAMLSRTRLARNIMFWYLHLGYPQNRSIWGTPKPVFTRPPLVIVVIRATRKGFGYPVWVPLLDPNQIPITMDLGYRKGYPSGYRVMGSGSWDRGHRYGSGLGTLFGYPFWTHIRYRLLWI